MDILANPNKIDLGTNRTKDQWKSLLVSVKINNDDPKTGKPFLSKNEQDFYVKEITYKITGQRFSREDVKKAIEDGAADIDDIG